MPTVDEARLQHVVDHAQRSLHSHELYLQRDVSYHEILEFVDELVDLMLEVRRERAALEQIVRLGAEQLRAGRAGEDAVAERMYEIARSALDAGESAQGQHPA